MKFMILVHIIDFSDTVFENVVSLVLKIELNGLRIYVFLLLFHFLQLLVDIVKEKWVGHAHN